MGASRTSFEKLQRDRAKKARAAAKRERRQDRDGVAGEPTELTDLPPEGEEIAPDVLLQMVAELHQAFDDGDIDFEEFEERKTELFARLTVD